MKQQPDYGSFSGSITILAWYGVIQVPSIAPMLLFASHGGVIGRKNNGRTSLLTKQFTNETSVSTSVQNGNYKGLQSSDEVWLSWSISLQNISG